MAEEAFVDTNLFLRYLTNDIPEQADQVERLLDKAEAGEVQLITSTIVVAEVAWTLSSFYKLDKREVRDAVLALANTPGLTIRGRDHLIQAAYWFEEKNVDFTDALIAAGLADEGPDTIYTYNIKHFKRFDTLDVRTPAE